MKYIDRKPRIAHTFDVNTMKGSRVIAKIAGTESMANSRRRSSSARRTPAPSSDRPARPWHGPPTAAARSKSRAARVSSGDSCSVRSSLGCRNGLFRGPGYPARARVLALERRGKNGRERGGGLVVFWRGRRIRSRGRQLAHPPTGQRTVLLIPDRGRPIRGGGPIRVALRRSVDVPVEAKPRMGAGTGRLLRSPETLHDVGPERARNLQGHGQDQQEHEAHRDHASILPPPEAMA